MNTSKIATRMRPKPSQPQTRVDKTESEAAMTWLEGRPILLDLAPGDVHAVATKKHKGKTLVLIQLAECGDWKGHPAGAFSMTAETWREIVSNWRRDGALPIPIDAEHASESAPTSGNIPSQGAPAMGWIHELVDRGVAGLFGWVEWLEPARSYIKQGRYKFLSPAVRFGSKDRVTGEACGARLSSAAITNTPWLRGMPPLVALTDKSALAKKEREAAEAVAKREAAGGEAQRERMADQILADEDEEEEDPAAMSDDADACAECAAKDATIAELRAKLAEHDDERTSTMVDTAISVHRLTIPRPALLALAKADATAFAQAYPAPLPGQPMPVPHLLATGPGRRDAPPQVQERSIAMSEAAAAPLPTIDDMVTTIMKEDASKGITPRAREVVYIEAHDRLADVRQLRRDAALGGGA